MSVTSGPFPAGPNVGSYVELPEFESSLAYLSAKLLDGPGRVAVCGPPGVGKTLALRLLLKRHGDQFAPVYVPSAALTPAEMACWVAASLRRTPGASLLEMARECATAGRPLLLAIDESQLASAELIAELDACCGAEGSAVAVLAWCEDEGAPIPPALVGCKTRVFLEPLELAEVPRFVAAQLDRVDASGSLRALLSGETLERIALASGGNPRTIQRLADREIARQTWRDARGTVRAQRASPPQEARSTPATPRRGLISAPSREPRAARRKWWAALSSAIAGKLAPRSVRRRPPSEPT